MQTNAINLYLLAYLVEVKIEKKHDVFLLSAEKTLHRGLPFCFEQNFKFTTTAKKKPDYSEI